MNRNMDEQIRAVSREAAEFAGAAIQILSKMLDDASEAKRGAAVCLLHDFADGNLPLVSDEVRAEIARRIAGRRGCEDNPFTHELMARELDALRRGAKYRAASLATPSDN